MSDDLDTTTARHSVGCYGSASGSVGTRVHRVYDLIKALQRLNPDDFVMGRNLSGVLTRVRVVDADGIIKIVGE